ncbi:hypothetical protein [Cytobacillus purgationiresistens]|uniref:Uncharacterized protein n=1 Tax=Cytobacillus purgationiresistens TaxID=863449 RepID=A0ABU0APE7_9BACI|nr:hypothetical protein [Cytobacillus purgationiresistens]MDQ0272734.1 hypothetical protein [Cytobacillus purgationiresistens]
MSIIAFKVSLDFYSVFFVYTVADYFPNYLLSISIILLIGGLIYLALSTIRAIKRVKKGAFREEGTGLYGFSQSKSYVSLPIIFGATMMGGAIARTLGESSNTLAQSATLYKMLFFTVLIQFAIAFALPEFQLVTYCKYRFESYNLKKPKGPLKETPRERLMAKKNDQQVKASNTAKQKKSKE